MKLNVNKCKDKPPPDEARIALSGGGQLCFN